MIDGLKNVKVIALDWDGTVVDSVPYKVAQNQAIAREFGHDLSLDEVRRIWNEAAGFPALMQQLTGSTDMGKIMEVVKRDYDNPAYAKREFGFAKAALMAMRAENVQLGVLTNATREILQLDAGTLGFNLQKDFDYTQAADEYKHKKPDGRVFVPLLSHFGIAAHQLLYVGDELKDYQAAQNIGSQFIGVTTGMLTEQEFQAAGIPFVKNISEIKLS